jgi:GntR family transcriptional regulator of vanillate catabolism
MSQESKVVAGLREMIVSGALEPGQRILEVPLAEQLGLSRTPVRFALGILAAEGLIEGGQKRGYHVKHFSMKDIVDAIDIRGALEGVAGRILAENRPGASVRQAFDACLADGDELLRDGVVHDGDDQIFETINRRFHKILSEAAGNKALQNALAANDRLPFAAAGAVAVETRAGELLRSQYEFLLLAQMQHRTIVEAIFAGQSGRAEALLQEHANLAKRNILWLSERGKLNLTTRSVSVGVAADE